MKIVDWVDEVLISPQAGPIDSVRLRHNTPGEPFPVRVTPRSKEHEELILKEANHCGVLESAEEGF